MAFNRKIVDQGVDMLKRFGSERELGKPTRIMMAGEDEPFSFIVGVGLEWSTEGREPVRNAVRLSSHEDAAEIKRRLEDW